MPKVYNCRSKVFLFVGLEVGSGFNGPFGEGIDSCSSALENRIVVRISSMMRLRYAWGAHC